MKDKDVVISRWAGEVKRLSALVEHLAAENRHLRETLSALQAENQSLREEIARLKKNSSNSSKPPSSDIVKPAKPASAKPSNGKAGGQPGHAKYERPPFPPEQIHRTRKYELSKKRAAGLIPLNDWHVVQQVELRTRPFWIVEYRARKYRDPVTGRIVIAVLPPEVVRGGLVGPRLSALIAYQKSACHMSYTTIQTFLKDVFGLSLSTGQLAKVIQKASAALAGPYEELQVALASQGCLGIDETGHPEKGDNLWTWCFRADDFTVFHIDPSRGSQVLHEVLGETFGGVIGCDYFSAYRAYMSEASVTVQFCLAHLIREIRFLAEHPNRWVSAWGQKLLAWLRKLFHTLHRREKLTGAGFARSMDRIRRNFLTVARRPPPHSEAAPLAKRFQDPNTAEAYFTFLTTPNVEPTNNRTERALRPLVIDRRITQGTRGHRGRRWYERAWTVLTTCRDQGRSAFAFLCQSMRAHLTNLPAPSLLPLPP
jgi:transposase